MSVYDGYGMLSCILVRPTSADWAIWECYLESYPTLNHRELSRAYHHPSVISVSSGQSAEKLTMSCISPPIFGLDVQPALLRKN